MAILGGASYLELVVLSWAIVSFVLYSFIMLLIVRNSHSEPFNSHFYKLFVWLGIGDLLSSLYNYLVRLFRIWGVVDWRPLFYHSTLAWWFRMASDTGTYYLTWVSYIGVLAISINRFCGFVYPGKWSNGIQKVAIFCQWCIPVIFVVPRLTTEYEVFPRNVSGVVYLTAGLKLSYATEYKILIGIVLPMLLSLAVAVLYQQMWAHVSQLKRDFGLTDDDRSELRLAWVGFILFISMSSITLFVVCDVANAMTARNRILSWLLNKLISISIVFFSLCNPWLLLICSKQTRRAVRSWFCDSQNSVNP